jgi:hypothetical protein
MRGVGMAHDARERLQPSPLGFRKRHQQKRSRTIRDRGGVGGRHRPLGREGRTERADLLRPGPQRLLVLREILRWRILSFEGSVPQRVLCAGERDERIVVLRLPGILAGRRQLIGVMAHQTAFIGILKAIGEHVVADVRVAEPQPLSRLRQKVGGIAHRFHAARHDDAAAPCGNCIMGRDDRLHAGAADLGNGGAGNALAQPRSECCLPRRVLTETRTEHVAHEHLIRNGACGIGHHRLRWLSRRVPPPTGRRARLERRRWGYGALPRLRRDLSAPP